MGSDKLLAIVESKAVLQWTIDAFANCDEISEIVLICPPERASALQLPPGCVLVDGGVERQDSVFAGLQRAGGDYVAIHDGARPLITAEAIRRTISAAMDHGAASLAKPVTETLKRANGLQQVAPDSVPIDRASLWSMETPQVFKRELILAAYQMVISGKHTVTDEVSALQLFGHPVQLVESLTQNLKITFPPDLALARRLLAAGGTSA